MKGKILKTRLNLTKMLLALSDDALEYVMRPIVYAYYYTDQRDPDRLTDDDVNRLCLIGAVAHGSEKTVSTLALMNRARKNALIKKNISQRSPTASEIKRREWD